MSHITEEQQVEALKKFLREYGVSIAAGVVLALSLGLAFRLYRHRVQVRGERASALYERLMVDVMNRETADAKKQAATLMRDFARTPYSVLAALTLAKFAVENKKWEEAEHHLQWAMAHGRRDFRELARVRLARVYVARDRPEDALRLLEKAWIHSAFSPLIFELRGDVYAQQKKWDLAREAYQTALSQLPAQAMMRPLLEMKLSDLPAGAPSAPTHKKAPDKG